jgi:hypothetical protein
MSVIRSLLTLGNRKVGESIHVWSLPAVRTCPGATATCKSVCYATRHRYHFDAVKERLAWNLEEAERETFVGKMVKEVRRKGCLVVRVHSAGDFFSKVYAEKWLEIMKACPRPRFYFYTRSHRVPEIAPALESMAALKCCRAWYSIDRDTGFPDRVPPNVRVALLQVDENDEADSGDLLFRVRKLRKKKRLGLPVVCPSETPKGHDSEINCGSCGRCWS